MAALHVGDLAPDFELMNQDLRTVRLADLRGRRVVLLFYPMDFSPACTAEFCGFGPDLSGLTPGEDTIYFGVSCDTPFAHAAFRERYNLPLDLLADPTRRMAKAYGMWAGEEPFNCTKRGTIVIDSHGRVAFRQEVGVDDVRTTAHVRQAVGR